jgi:Ca2+-binding RTX toxin-like protein
MKRWLFTHGTFAAIMCALLACAGAGAALAATNAVSTTHLYRQQTPVTVNTVKDPNCSAIVLTTIINGTSGGSADEFILGTGAAESISGGNGNDCIMGGGGNDNINGGPGTDVCIGGPGVDTFSHCETQIQ